MRIIAGKDCGRVIDCPDGMDTRPTIDRVRESIMSAVYSSIGDFEGKSVLDLFAGSGALGIESLSRGCDFVVFNDNAASARRCIERNIASLGYKPEDAKICSIDALSGCPIPTREPFDIVFLDPPYKTDQASVYEEIASLIDNGTVSKDALMVYEHDTESDPDVLASYGFELEKEKKYGKTIVSYFRSATP